jgi:O-antigen ligase
MARAAPSRQDLTRESEMNNMSPGIPERNFKTQLHSLNSLLLIAFGLVLPNSVAIANILALMIFLLWLLQGNFGNDLAKVRNNTLVRAILAFWLLHLIGLLWTSDIAYGMEIIAKESLLLLVPVFMMVLEKKWVKATIGAFMASMLFSSLLSFLMWLKLIPNWKGEPDPVPFMGSISYSPYLTIAIYIALYFLLLDPTSGKRLKIFAAITALLMSIDIFITKGRAGQVMYFIMIIIVIVQYYRKNLLRAMIIAGIALPLIMFTAYKTSDMFRNRIKEAVSNIEHYDSNKHTPLGERMTFVRNSLEIIREHPLAGVGTGDFKMEYAAVNQRNTPEMPATVQPHDMYVLEMVQFGMIGLASLLWILVAQIRIALSSDMPIQKRFGLALPILFAVIMLSDSYLLGHFTTMLFVFFSSILYQDHA